MGYWRNSEWRKCQGTENVSQDGRGNLWAEGLTGDVAFSPGTQPMHGDLTGREHRKKKIAGLSPIFRLLLVLPLADPILQASGKTILSRRNSSWPYLLFYIHQHWQGFLCLKLLTLVMLLPHKRYWKRCKQAHMLGVTRKIPVNLTHLSL